MEFEKAEGRDHPRDFVRISRNVDVALLDGNDARQPLLCTKYVLKHPRLAPE